MAYQTRKYTCMLLDMVDQGVIDPKKLVEACLSYMSEADVYDMAWTNEFILGEDDEGDEEENENE